MDGTIKQQNDAMGSSKVMRRDGSVELAVVVGLIGFCLIDRSIDEKTVLYLLRMRLSKLD